MKELQVFNFKGQNVTDSRLVAEMVGMQHKDLLEKVRNYTTILEGGKLRSLDFFIPSEYKSKQNKTLPCYLLTKQGCEMVANKLTGEKGVIFTAEYVKAFNQMESTPKLPTSPMEILRLTFEAFNEIDGKFKDFKEDVDKKFDEMPLFGVDQDEIKHAINVKAVSCLGGKDSNAYCDNSIRGKVYSDIHSQIRREFGVDSYKAIQRNKVQIVLEIVRNYKLPISLAETITNANNQQSMELRA